MDLILGLAVYIVYIPISQYYNVQNCNIVNIKKQQLVECLDAPRPKRNLLMLVFSNEAAIFLVCWLCFLALLCVIFCFFVRWTALQFGYHTHYRDRNLYWYRSYFYSIARCKFFQYRQTLVWCETLTMSLGFIIDSFFNQHFVIFLSVYLLVSWFYFSVYIYITIYVWLYVIYLDR